MSQLSLKTVFTTCAKRKGGLTWCANEVGEIFLSYISRHGTREYVEVGLLNVLGTGKVFRIDNVQQLRYLCTNLTSDEEIIALLQQLA